MIPGIELIDSGKPGPCLGITVCTHGNEPAGLAALEYIRGLELKCGRVYLVVVNLKGAEAYKAAKTKEERAAARFIDINFNRLPENALELEDERYEIQRLQALMPVFEKFDFAMDIHSTTQESKPMIIRGGKFDSDLVRGFPIQTVISRIDEKQIGLPGFAFHGGERKIPTFEIECGSHEDPTSFELAIECSKQLLINLEMIEGQSGELRDMDDYEIADTLVFPNKTYRLEKVFSNFEKIQKGQKLADGDKGPIFAQFDGHAILGPDGLTPTKWDEEVLFLTHPPCPMI